MPNPVPPTPEQRRLRNRVAAIGAIAVVAAAVGLVVGREPLLGGGRSAVAGLRAAGPVPFFLGMALLPAIGFPLLPFSLAAGPVFGPRLGVGGTIACATIAVAINVALSYALAAGWLRPGVIRLLERLGYRLPPLPAGTAWQVVWLVRLMPGLPFWVQSYLLGLAHVPIGPYLAVSVALPSGYIAATILLGDALLGGNVRLALYAFAALGLLAIGLRLGRRLWLARSARSVEPHCQPKS